MKRHVVRLLCAAVRPLRVLLSRPHSGRAVALAMLLSMTGAQALAQGASQAYPSRPIRMIVTFAPGSATDTVARIYGQKMAEILGQPVIVENRPGAVGTIGADAGIGTALPKLAARFGASVPALRPLLAELPALAGPGEAWLLMPPIDVR